MTTQALAWIEDGWIYPVKNSTSARLATITGEFIYNVKGATRAFIRDGHIYLNSGGYTHCYLQDEWIYGPDAIELSWL